MVVLLLFALCAVTASAASSGTLVATDALGIKEGEEGNVQIFLNGSYDPLVRGIRFNVYYNEEIVECTKITLNTTGLTGNPPSDKSSGFVIQLLSTSGMETEKGLWLGDITFKAKKGDGSKSEIGLHLGDIGAGSTIKYINVTSIQNGTFTTKDEVDPVITITTQSRVPKTFNISGTIYDVGGMGNAQATLKNGSSEKSFSLHLSGSAPSYTFSDRVEWPVYETLNLTVKAIDAAGGQNSTSRSIEVMKVGFSDPEPTGFIRVKPDQVRVFMNEMNGSTVKMNLGSTTYGPVPLTVTIDGNDALGKLPLILPDDKYWVNVSGTDNFGDEQFLNWTFTLDTVPPVIKTFEIADSDGDGYIEAGETLRLNWSIDNSEQYFSNVSLVDSATGEVVWQSTTRTGPATATITDGNRDLAFRAYDIAGNNDSCPFHLYYNYMIWVNSTKVGVVSGIDTTYAAAKDLSRTDLSSVTLYNGREVPLPDLNSLGREVTNLGQVTSDTYVVADNTANATLQGSQTYQNVWVYNPGTTLDFNVKVPHAPRAVLLLAEANESYIAELIDGGSSSWGSVDYMELIQKTAYIFIDGGWAKVSVDDDNKLVMENSSGKALTMPGNVTQALRAPQNQVDLNAGYRLSAQRYNGAGLTPITLPPGDYTLAAVAMDGDRTGLLAAMPVVVVENADQGSVSPATVKQDESFTAKFSTPCERLGVVLLRDDVSYSATALIDAATLGKDTLSMNITHSGIPATQKLIGNIYVSPNSGKYVLAKTSEAVVSTTGLDVGTYRVYLVGQSPNGTLQAFGTYSLMVTSKVTPTPQPTTAPSAGGGGGRGGFAPVTGSSSLSVGTEGKLLRPYTIRSPSGIAEVDLPLGTYAVDAYGNPLTEVSVDDLDPADVPGVPSGAAYTFAGYAVVCSPSGARFEPAIDLVFAFNADQWSEIMQMAEYDASSLVVKWYDEATGEWETVPTTVDPASMRVTASVKHFSIFGLFVEPGAVTPVVTPTTPTVTPTTPTTTTPVTPPAEGFPWTYVVIAIVIILVIAAGIYYYTRKP